MQIVIPAGLTFSDLRLTREPSGDVAFDTQVVARIAVASSIDPAVFLESAEDHVAGLIVAWYQQHRAHGGDIDPTAEDLIAEAMLEGKRGSHQPGRA